MSSSRFSAFGIIVGTLGGAAVGFYVQDKLIKAHRVGDEHDEGAMRIDPLARSRGGANGSDM
jgi:hypothetical protein